MSSSEWHKSSRSLCHCLFLSHLLTPKSTLPVLARCPHTPSTPPQPLLSPFLGPLISLAYWLLTLFSSLSFFIRHSLTQSIPPLSISLSLSRVFRGPPHLLHLPAPLLRSALVISVRWRKRTTKKKKKRGEKKEKPHTCRCGTHMYTRTIRSKSAEVPADVPFIAICCEKCESSSQRDFQELTAASCSL